MQKGRPDKISSIFKARRPKNIYISGDARKKIIEQNVCLRPDKIHRSNALKIKRDAPKKKYREKCLFDARQNVDKIHRSNARKKYRDVFGKKYGEKKSVTGQTKFTVQTPEKYQDN